VILAPTPWRYRASRACEKSGHAQLAKVREHPNYERWLDEGKLDELLERAGEAE
jgi:hypothetical protein